MDRADLAPVSPPSKNCGSCVAPITKKVIERTRFVSRGGGSRVAKSGRWMVTATCHPPQALTIRLRANPADCGRTRPSMRWSRRDAPVNRGLHRQPHAEPGALIYLDFGALALVASRNRGSRVATPCDIVRLLHRGAAR